MLGMFDDNGEASVEWAIQRVENKVREKNGGGRLSGKDFSFYPEWKGVILGLFFFSLPTRNFQTQKRLVQLSPIIHLK